MFCFAFALRSRLLLRGCVLLCGSDRVEIELWNRNREQFHCLKSGRKTWLRDRNQKIKSDAPDPLFAAVRYSCQKGSPTSFSAKWEQVGGTKLSCLLLRIWWLLPSYSKYAESRFCFDHGEISSTNSPTAVDARTPFGQTTCGRPPASRYAGFSLRSPSKNPVHFMQGPPGNERITWPEMAN